MLILASASQSRKKLLENSKIEFIQIPSNFDEASIKVNDISNMALELSFQKANFLVENIRKLSLPINLHNNSVQVLGCDSIFELNGIAFGKPSDKEEAFIRWKKMSGKYGFLHTGHTLILGNLDLSSKVIKVSKEIKTTVISKVYFSKLQDEEIKSYIDSGEPLYCAGGFALEGRGGKYIEKIEGCFSNVMGLSLPWLRKNLINEGIFT